MGSRFRVYAGPYLRCLNPETTSSKRVRTCPNTACFAHANESRQYDHFCGNCGSAISEVQIPAKRPTVDSWKLYDALHDRLRIANAEYSEKNVDLWSLNLSQAFGRTLYMDDDTGEHPVDPELELAAFKSDYISEIAILTEAYGQHSVTVLWGLIGEYV